MTVAHLATTDNDILRWGIPLATIHIATGFDGYAVIAGLEDTVLNENTVARLRIATVAIRAIVDDGDAADDEVFAKEWMEHPEW